MGKRIEYITGSYINGFEFIKEAEPDVQTGRVERLHRRGWFTCPRCNVEFTNRYATIKSGKIYSCGCLNKSGEAAITHGLTGTRIMKIWTSMKQRCNNPNHTAYSYYGAKGITVCGTWLNDVAAFNQWAVSSGYQEDLTLDRIERTKGYSPENCRWETKTIQARNRGINRNNSSGYKGVHVCSRSNGFIARITVNYESLHLGSFVCPKEAAKAYNLYVVTNNLEHTLNEV